MVNLTERRAMTGIAIRWAHLIIAIAVYLLTIGAMYASMNAKLEEATRRIQDLEQQSIRRDQFQEFRDDLKHRLDTLEGTMLERKALRELK